MRTLKKLGPAVLALLAGGAVALVVRHQTATKAKTSHVSEPDAPSSLCRFDAERLAYDVDIEAGLALAIGVDPNQEPAKFPLKGRLVVEPVRASAGRQVVAAVFDGVEGTGMDVEAYRHPFLFELDRQCQVVAFARHNTTRPAYARQEQVIAHELGTWLATEKRDQAEGVRHGTDAQGAFSQTMAATRTGEGVRVTGGPRTYSKVWLGPLPSQSTGQSVTTFDREPWFATMTADRTFAVDGATQTFHISAKRVPNVSKLEIPKDESEYSWGDFLPTATVETTGSEPLPAEREEIRAMSATEASARYAALFDTQAHMGAAGTFLRNYAEAHPAFAYEILKEVEDGKLDGMKAATVFPALQITRTKEARRALSNMRESPATSAFDRARATLALASRADASSALVESLAAEVAHPVAQGDHASTFGVGESYVALGLVVSHASSAVADQAKRVLRDRAQSEHTGAAVSAISRAIANAGDADFVGQVVEWSHRPEVDVRHDAAAAFRRMPVDKTGEAQAAWLTYETDLRVRGAVYDTAWKQAFDQNRAADERVLAAAVKEAGHTPDNFVLRQSLIRVLGEAAKVDTEKAKVLGQMYATEPSSDLRDLIGRYVPSEYLQRRTAP
jgi:hypothetical protein